MSGRGPLKLKGGSPLKLVDSGVKKKKKSKQGKEDDMQLARAESGEHQQQNSKEAPKDILSITRGYELKQPSENEDRRTEAEKRFEQRQIQLEQERLKKLAAKSHRDRVADFNSMLANLSEHHDIPRIGPG